MTLEEALDRLYQSPLADFTAERRRLATQTPKAAAAIAAAQKPTLAAWAVNQLFWHRRRTTDKVVRAAERVRDVQLQRLAGKPADLDAADRDRRTAIDAAIADAGDLLAGAGQQASPATLEAIRETLETLPWTTLDGRLVRPVKPTGLEGLAALKGGAAIAPRKPAAVVPMPPRAGRRTEAGRETLERLRGELDTLERELRDAEATVRQAKMTVEKTQAAARQAEAARAEAEAALEAAARIVEERRRSAREAERGREQAERTRDLLDRQVAEKRAAVEKQARTPVRRHTEPG